MTSKTQTAEQTHAPQQRYHPKHRVRFITAASLFDGHDASINIMRRILQATGAEVIHLGHNRSANEIVTAALEEDASAIAISSYQGGHVEFFKYIVDLLRDAKADHIQVFGGGGGTITPDEINELHQYGVKRLYSPEDGRKLGLQGIINDMVASADRSPLKSVDWLSLTQTKNHPLRLAKALTCLELAEDKEVDWRKHKGDLEKLRKSLKTALDGPIVIGITGTGGAGKSSFTDELTLRILEDKAHSKKKPRVGILAIDPTRRKTGGALLGDRLRMNSLQSDRCFMRSLATRRSDSALSSATQEAIALLKKSGFDWILVETGGIGQADTSIVDLVDINLYVMTQEFGAATQLEKINMLDYADVVIVNKFEKPGSLDAVEAVRKQFRRNHLSFESLPTHTYPVFGTVASRFNDPGIDAVYAHLKQIAKQEDKRQPLEVPFKTDSLPSASLLPKSSTGYLSDIARRIRDYKENAREVAARVGEIDSIEALLNETTLSKKTHEELAHLKEVKRASIPPEVSQLLEDHEKRAEQYKQSQFTHYVREKPIQVDLQHQSLSGNAIRKVVPPKYRSKEDLTQFLLLENLPGYFPYTAGVFPFKRAEEEPKRMFAGEGTPEKTNQRFHYLCEGEKAHRLSTAFDSVTLYGEDPDKRPDIFGKIGESGVSICSLEDTKKLYAGFDLCAPSTSVSMTINGPAPMLLAFYFNTAIDQQVDRFASEQNRQPTPDEYEKIKSQTLMRVRGTVQADILKEDQAQNTCIFSTGFALKVMGDIQEYFVKNKIRNYYSVSISGYHIAEAGANPITQMAFTLANGFTLVEYYKARGMKVDAFAPNLSFFFSNGLDAEYAVIGRVARRIWSIAMKHRYNANERSQKLKYHIQTSGRSLHAQEISFNDIRTTLQALIAYYDYCNSLHTNAYDEAVTTPTAESVRRAMAIQLIIAREFGVAKNENPLQGSFFIEELTELVEEAILAEFERLSFRGDVLGAMETQYQRNKIQEESLHYERKKHSGELPIVGVNTFLNPDEDAVAQAPANLTRATYEEKNAQIAHLREFHKRNEKQAPLALARLKKAAKNGGNVFSELLNTARYCSLGQMTRALYEIGGQYRRSV